MLVSVWSPFFTDLSSHIRNLTIAIPSRIIALWKPDISVLFFIDLNSHTGELVRFTVFCLIAALYIAKFIVGDIHML